MDESGIENSGEIVSPDLLIQNSGTIEELKDVINEIGPIRGSGRLYSPEKIIGYIDGVTKGSMDIHYITRAYGLRDKVRKLLNLPPSEMNRMFKSINRDKSFSAPNKIWN